MDNTSSTAVAGTISISSVTIDGMQEMRLNAPVMLDAGSPVDAFALCRMCLLRMPLGTLERLALGYALVADETGLGRMITYRELGKVLGRCEHSVKAAVASLRKAGLAMTARTGYSSSAVSFTASPLVSWAVGVLKRSAAKPAVSETTVSVHTDEESVHESGFSVPKEPESVSKTRRRRAQALAAKKEYQTPAAGQPAVVEATTPHEGEFRSSEELVWPAVPPPLPAPAKAEPVDELGMAPAYEGEFDNTAEVADTLRAAGREAGEGPDDEDDISFGSETADTDMGQGVRINPNL